LPGVRDATETDDPGRGESTGTETEPVRGEVGVAVVGVAVPPVMDPGFEVVAEPVFEGGKFPG